MRKTRRRKVEPGSPPGQFQRSPVGAPARTEVVDYTQTTAVTQSGELVEPAPSSVNRWVRITGTPGTALLESIHDRFGVHALVLEDIVNGGTRIKTEDFDSLVFAVLRAVTPIPTGGTEEIEIDLLLFERTLITVEHTAGDSLLVPIAERLKREDTLIRRRGVDVLFYAVVDLVVDLLFPHVDDVAVAVEELEGELFQTQTPSQLAQIQSLKTQTQRVMSIAWSTRHAVTRLERTDHNCIGDTARFYLRDVSDHIVQLIDTIGDLKENSHNLMDLYRSGVSNGINDVMKVLTIISTVFIPITFIAGIYGMNFANMPELATRWAYPVVLGIMGVVAIGMLIFFKRRKWF